MLVGGERSVVESCRDILETVGHRIINVGPLGSGVAVKLINNLTVAVYLFSLLEGFALARKTGADVDKLFDLQKENLLHSLRENQSKSWKETLGLDLRSA